MDETGGDPAADGAMLTAALGGLAPYGRWCLVGGLVAGLGLPELALALRPYLPHMIAVLLFLAALRIGPRAAIGTLDDIGRTIRTSLVLQCALPVAALAVLLPLGLAAASPAIAVVLVLSAPPVTGSPNLTIMLGHDPSAAMRLLLIGTAIFPVTVIPVLALSPVAGSAAEVVFSALRLLAVILGAVGLAFAIRAGVMRDLRDERRAALDGASALVMGIVVVGLMSAAGPALKATPGLFAGWLVLAFTINLALQVGTYWLAPHRKDGRDRTATSIVAGNRNIALFLIALPEATMGTLLLFIGCWQFPMYLTPILMRRLIA